MDEHQNQWWWCMRHNRVEPYEGCAERYRIGPFDSQAEAARGLEIIKEREERKIAEDKRWEEGK